MKQFSPVSPSKFIHRLQLDNGITLIVRENPTADLISGRFFWKQAGTLWEKPEKAGIFHLLASVLTKGTQTMSSLDIAEAIESMGASLGGDTASDYFMMSIKTVSADFKAILNLLAEIVRSPTFPEEEITLEKQLICQSIRSQQEQPFNIAFNQLRQTMYGEHPYGRSILGTEETVCQVSREDLQQCHYEHFRPSNLIISLSGNLTLNQGVALIEKTFGTWENTSPHLTLSSLPRLTVSPSEVITHQSSQQTIIMLGYLAVGVAHIDYPVLKLLSTYLGNGLSSRLFVELREKKGLAYDVSAFFPTRLHPSNFVTYIGTAPHNTNIAIEGLKKETERLCEIELTLEELQTAKNKLLGQYALGKQTNAEVAHLYGWYETLGLGIEFDQKFPEFINNITSEMVQKAAKNYLLSPYVSIVGSEITIN
ncbi:peptidase, M16B family [Crocosphaera subtropica ATCC 51142]|uniref:Peptidase, M16B family n=1 Tax=Crocosphaera subtropica (strain ATCC 51142 / BH68) TaxID=43989 RepID=B1WV56_CROS5|nr:pitrilysin family protein [Crocosphaera subtropica]ACB52253.1 peptidase, M16B family [Crocosphaera subtropica ATCC 51142]